MRVGQVHVREAQLPGELVEISAVASFGRKLGDCIRTGGIRCQHRHVVGAGNGERNCLGRRRRSCMSVVECNRVDDLNLLARGQEVEHVVGCRKLRGDSSLVRERHTCNADIAVGCGNERQVTQQRRILG